MDLPHPLGVNLQFDALREPEVTWLSLKRGKIGPKVTKLRVGGSNFEGGSLILARPNKDRPVSK